MAYCALMGSPTQYLTEVRSKPIDFYHCSMRQQVAQCKRYHHRACEKKHGLSSVTLVATSISCRCTVMKKQYKGSLYDWLSTWMPSFYLKNQQSPWRRQAAETGEAFITASHTCRKEVGIEIRLRPLTQFGSSHAFFRTIHLFNCVTC